MVTPVPELLNTKLTPPVVRAGCVHRPRLTQWLSTSLDHPLILICAPAGYGKSTLIGEWLASEAGNVVPVAWLSLDEDDNDTTRFLTYLVSAFTTIIAIDGDEILLLLHSPRPPTAKIILTALLSRLEAFTEQFVLVLDDYHVITAQPVHDAVMFLLDHLPPRMCMVICSRDDPPLPLARLRGRGQLADIRADDLRFTPEEAAQFLAQMLGVKLSADEVRDLDARTEGWIAGLQLAALALNGREDVGDFIAAFTGSHRYILDYLTEEVLSRQSESVQSFLLQTSILNRLNGALCDTLTSRTDGQAMLEQIERGNLFLIPLDDERYWYRYHHLFRDMLLRRLQQTFPDSVRELHRRASKWFEQIGWVGESVEHAILSEDSERVATLVEHHVQSLWMRGKAVTVLRWLKVLPKAVLFARPRLALNYAFMLTTLDEFDEAGRLLAEAEHALDEIATDDPARPTLLGQAAAIRATILVQIGNDGDQTIAAGHQALAQLSGFNDYWRRWVMMIVGVAEWLSNGDTVAAHQHLEEAVKLSAEDDDIYTLIVSLSYLTRIELVEGNLAQIEASCHRLLQRAAALGWRGQPVMGIARLNRAWVRYERNDLAGAYDDVVVGQQAVHGYGLTRVSMPSYVLLARLQILQVNPSGARESLRQAAEIMQSGKLRPVLISISAWQAWLWLKQGDLASASLWAQEIEPTSKGQLNSALEFEHLTLARVQMAQGRLDEAQALLTRLRSAAQTAERIGRVIAICVLQALASRLQGNMDEALKSIADALSLSESEGYMRVFLDEGAPMAALLRDAQRRGIAPEYVERLLATLDGTASVSPRQWVGETTEPLSARELQVLRLLADGASNREIAQKLVVTVGTVKRHLNNVFTKLDAHSRTQAVAIARQQDLL